MTNSTKSFDDVEFITVADAVRHFGAIEHRIRQAIQSGELPHIMATGSRRIGVKGRAFVQIPKAELLDWLRRTAHIRKGVATWSA